MIKIVVPSISGRLVKTRLSWLLVPEPWWRRGRAVENLSANLLLLASEAWDWCSHFSDAKVVELSPS